MAQGIVRVTPKSPGTLEVTVVDPANPFKIRAGQMLSFAKPGFPVALNDIVDFDALSDTAAKVTKVHVAIGTE
ncbi:MAG: hypothetical protein ABIT08_08075 [Bacteroidia bacterium]